MRAGRNERQGKKQLINTAGDNDTCKAIGCTRSFQSVPLKHSMFGTSALTAQTLGEIRAKHVL